MSDELLTLATRVEIVSGSDRDLDHAIADAVLGKVKAPYTRGHCEKYTTTLEAAMTLLPEGNWYWAVKHYPNAQCAADVGGIYTANAPSPARALTAACLRARASHLRMEVE